MENFSEELAIAEMANTMRDQFGARAIEIAEEQGRMASTTGTRATWRKIALKLRRWDQAE